MNGTQIPNGQQQQQSSQQQPLPQQRMNMAGMPPAPGIQGQPHFARQPQQQQQQQPQGVYNGQPIQQGPQPAHQMQLQQPQQLQQQPQQAPALPQPAVALPQPAPVQPKEDTYIDPKQLIHSIYEKGNVGYTQCEDDLLQIAPEFELLNQLIKYEAMVDKMVKRKRFDLQEQFARPTQKMSQIFRLYITNDSSPLPVPAPQPQQEGEDPMQIEPEQSYKWTLKLYGHLLQEDKNNASTLVTQKQQFSDFFQKITVEFNPHMVKNPEPIQWRKSDKQEQGVLISKISSQETIVTINFHMYNNPLKFKVDARLANIIGFDQCTRSTALAAIWEYIKLKNLQDAENKSEIICDDFLRTVFMQDKIPVGQISGKLRSLLHPPNPITIRHQIKLSGTQEENERIYDFVVEAENQLGMEIMPFFSQKVVLQEKKDSQKHPFITLNQKIKDLDKKFSDTLEKIKSHKFKRDSYYAYSTDPSLYIENTILQQNIYLQLMKEEPQPMIEDPSTLSYLRDNEDLVEREIKRYLDNLDGIQGEKDFDSYQQQQLVQLQQQQAILQQQQQQLQLQQQQQQEQPLQEGIIVEQPGINTIQDSQNINNGGQ